MTGTREHKRPLPPTSKEALNILEDAAAVLKERAKEYGDFTKDIAEPVYEILSGPGSVSKDLRIDEILKQTPMTMITLKLLRFKRQLTDSRVSSEQKRENARDLINYIALTEGVRVVLEEKEAGGIAQGPEESDGET